jgi:hypothetical protein
VTGRRIVQARCLGGPLDGETQEACTEWAQMFIPAGEDEAGREREHVYLAHLLFSDYDIEWRYQSIQPYPQDRQTEWAMQDGELLYDADGNPVPLTAGARLQSWQRALYRLWYRLRRMLPLVANGRGA